MPRVLPALYLFMLSFLLWQPQAKASHAMGADLTYTCLGGLQYEFTLNFYRDCDGISPSTSYTIFASSASCGQSTSFTVTQLGTEVEVSPLCPSQLSNSTCSSGTLPGVQQWTYTGTVTLPQACTDWVFSFSTNARNATVTTLVSPDLSDLYVESTLNNVAAPCNNSPSFTQLPVPYICLGQPYVYNHGATDADGDSLVYTLIDALEASGTTVTYTGAFSGTNPISSTPQAAIDPLTGNITMNPTANDIAVVAVLVQEYRNGVLIGSVIRDIQVTVLSCTNNSPTLNPLANVTGASSTGNYSLEVCPGTAISFDIPGTDADGGDNLTMTWNNGIPGGNFSTAGNNPVTGTFTWTPTVGDIGYNSFTVNISDDACPVLGSQTVAVDIIVVDRTSAGPDQAYCTAGSPVQLNATGGSVFNWNILSGDGSSLSCNPCADPFATPSVTTVYEVVSDLSGACITRDTVTVTVVPNFSLNTSPDNTICLGSSYPLVASPTPAGAYTYEWTPFDGSVADSSSGSTTASPNDTTTYYVEVTSSLGCRITDSLTVDVVDLGLTQAPTVNPVEACMGDPVTLNANVSSGACDDYSMSSISYNSTGGGGWTGVTLGDDDETAALPIGFTFNYFCNDYTNFYIHSNGAVSFSGDYVGTAPSTLPAAATPNDAIYLCWDDLNPSSGGTVRYKTIGTTPNQVLVVEFSNVDFYGSTSEVSGQVKLYESTNIVEIHVSEVALSGVHSMGIENSDGTVGLSPSGYNNVTYTIASNMAWRFGPVAAAPYTVSWQSPLGSTLGTGDTYVDNPSGDITYYSVLQDAGGVCTPIVDSLEVNVSSVDAGSPQAICAGDNAPLNSTFTGTLPTGAPSVCGASAGCDGSGGTAIGLSGTGTLSTGTGTPYEGFWHDGRVQYLYTAADLTAMGLTGGTITSIGWNVDIKGSTQAYSGFTIRMTCTSLTDLSSATFQSVPTTVYGPTAVTTSAGANIYTLTTPYDWDGTSNLLVEVCFNNTSYTSDDDVFYTTTGYTSVLYDYADSDVGCTLAFPTTSSSRPNTRFGMCYQTGGLAYTWTPGASLDDPNAEDPVASPLVSTWYYVTVDNGNCVMTDSVFVDVNCLLPLEMLSFTGERDGETSHLYWTTAMENHNSHFVVQRRETSGNWASIGTVQAVGESTTPTDYEFIDYMPMVGSNFYRLQAVDDMGESSPTQAVEVIFDDGQSALLSVHPNPSQGLFHFQFEPGTAREGQLIVYDLRGKIVRSLPLGGFNGGQEAFTLDLQGLSGSVYLFELQLGSNRFRGRLNLSK